MHSKRRQLLRFILLLCCTLGFRSTIAAPFHVYLTWQGNTSTTITINYQTRANGEQSLVYYDTAPRSGDFQSYAFSAIGSSHQILGLDTFDKRTIHVVELTDLNPGQTYYFIAGDPETGFSEEKKLRTVPSEAETLRFIAGGDMATGSVVGNLLSHAAQQNPMFGVIGGDIAYANGKLSNWDRWDKWLDNWENFMITPDGHMIPMVLAIGNHEVNKEDGPAAQKAPFYFGYFAQAPTSYFSRQFGRNTVLYVLDTDHVAPHEGAQVEWLADELERFEGVANKMAIYHIPFYPSHRDPNEGGSKSGRKYWLPLFDAHGLTVAFENHDHLMKRTKLLKANQPDDAGTLYIGDGCFGRTIRTADQANAFYIEKVEEKRHFWLVEVPEENAGSAPTFTAIDENGAIFDTYELPKKLSVSISDPNNADTYSQDEVITVRANAFYRRGSVASVEFFQNGIGIGTSDSAPHEIQWFNAPLGEHGLTAVATGRDGSLAISDTINITVFPPGSKMFSQTFTATEDAHVRFKRKTRNYGDRLSLEVRSSPSDTFRSYVKFNVPNLSGVVVKATARLFSKRGSEDGGAIYLVANDYKAASTPWEESGLIWNNAPSLSGSPLDVLGAVDEDQWVEFDVTTAISGAGTFSFGVQVNLDRVGYSSKEASSPPELVVEFLRRRPVISSFTPDRGPVGSEITITGEAFALASEIAFGGVPADSFDIDSDTQVRAIVPAEAVSGKITVANAAGTSASIDSFVVERPVPKVLAFTPGSGSIGTEITITGMHFDNVNAVDFNGVPAADFSVDAVTQIRATVPNEATSGRIGVANAYDRAVSPNIFTVLTPPEIMSFEPTSGPVGTEVTVTGSNFIGTTAVTFADTVSTFIVDSDSVIRATVSIGSKTGQITVMAIYGTARSQEEFVIIRPPTITSFSPPSGEVGIKVTILGTDFNTVTKISFGNIEASAFAIDSDQQICVKVPAGTTNGQIQAFNLAGSGTSLTEFKIKVPGPITRIFEVEHDSYIRSSRPAQTSGSAAILRVRQTATERSAFLKFNVFGLLGPVQSAKLRLLVTDSSDDGGDLYLVSNNFKNSTDSWTENGLAAQNAPTIDGAILGSLNVVEQNQVIEFDITQTVSADSVYSFAIRNASSDIAIYSSKEGEWASRLEIVSIESRLPAEFAPRITSFTPASGRIGQEVTIDGINFFNVTEIAFHAVKSPDFTIDSTTRLRTNVPAGALSGKIRVVNSWSATESASEFEVLALPDSITFIPVDDSYIRSNRATNNYGDFPDLVVRKSVATYVCYLKFEVSGLTGPPAKAVLKLKVVDPGPEGGSLFLSSNSLEGSSTTWSEAALTGNNAPELLSSALYSVGAVKANEVIEIDVTTLIPGNGTYTFALKNNSSDAVKYSSKEGVEPPTLFIEGGSTETSTAKINERSVADIPLQPKAGSVKLPRKFDLSQNYPNPFNAETTIDYALPLDSHVRLIIYNLLGQPVKVLISGQQEAGFKKVIWDGKSQRGDHLATGLYIIQLTTSEQVRTLKIVLQR